MPVPRTPDSGRSREPGTSSRDTSPNVIIDERYLSELRGVPQSDSEGVHRSSVEDTAHHPEQQNLTETEAQLHAQEVRNFFSRISASFEETTGDFIRSANRRISEARRDISEFEEKGIIGGYTSDQSKRLAAARRATLETYTPFESRFAQIQAEARKIQQEIEGLQLAPKELDQRLASIGLHVRIQEALRTRMLSEHVAHPTQISERSRQALLGENYIKQVRALREYQRSFGVPSPTFEQFDFLFFPEELSAPVARSTESVAAQSPEIAVPQESQVEEEQVPEDVIAALYEGFYSAYQERIAAGFSRPTEREQDALTALQTVPSERLREVRPDVADWLDTTYSS